MFEYYLITTNYVKKRYKCNLTLINYLVKLIASKLARLTLRVNN